MVTGLRKLRSIGVYAVTENVTIWSWVTVTMMMMKKSTARSIDTGVRYWRLGQLVSASLLSESVKCRL